MAEPPPDLEARVARAWLAAEGLLDGEPLVEAIDPADEMYLALADFGEVPPHQRRLDYFRAGRDACALLESLLAAAGRGLATAGALLEFASGHGRLTRHLVRRVPRGMLDACDIQPQANAFVARTFGVRALPSAWDPTQLVLPRRYGLVFVGSLFTHLPPQRCVPWLRRLHAALEPGGLLVFTTHGAWVAPEKPKDPSGYTFEAASESGRLAPHEYGTTFVTPGRLRALAAEAGVPLLACVEGGLWWTQDVHVVGDAPAGALAGWRGRPEVLGRIGELRVDAGGQAWIGGWALAPQWLGPVTEVVVHLDGAPLAEARLGSPVLASLGREARPGFVQVEWLLHGPAPPLAPGWHVLAVTGRSARGPRACFDATAFEAGPHGVRLAG